MGNRNPKRPARAWRIVLAIGAALAVCGPAVAAHAGSPVPYDFPSPPPNINVIAFYNEFYSASSFYTPNGTQIQNTRIQFDEPILRLIHTFTPIDGMAWGAQAIVTYASFLGHQEIGGAGLTANSGFAEPEFSAFIYPYNNPSEDSALGIAYFLSPPSGSYNPNDKLNPSSNNWINNLEVVYSHILFGRPKGQRLDFQIAGDTYIYSNNNDYRSGFFKGAKHIEPAEQIYLYLPYIFYPKTAAYVGLAFEQTFGGKQYLTGNINLPNGITFPAGPIDTGSRNNFTRIGFNFGSFVSPTVAVEGQLSTDIRTRGGAKYDVYLLLQAIKIF